MFRVASSSMARAFAAPFLVCASMSIALSSVQAADFDTFAPPLHSPHRFDGFNSAVVPTAQGESSVIRLGPVGRGATGPVADGRVERPSPRPGSEGSLPGGGESGLVVVRQDVRDLIQQVANFYGFDVVLTRQVRGDVENARLPSDLDMFIDRLIDDRDLVFYFRGRDLNVSAQSENVSRVIGLGPSDPNELRAAIESAGVDADRFPLQFIEASNSVLVAGPPSFVGLVEVIAESLVRTERSGPAVTVIRGNQIDRSEPDLPRVAPELSPSDSAPAQLN